MGYLRKRFSLAVAVTVLAACAPDASDPTAPNFGVTPLCQRGCVDIDPAPNAPGVFIGHDFTPDYCFDAGTDLDADGIRDYCEQRLSLPFAPELYYWNWDDIRREPYWAARPLSPTQVRIAYLLSYYRDHGSNTYTCSLPFAPSSCYGHNGDSETLLLDIYYNAVTEHWVLETAWYSAHGHYNVYSRGSKAYPTTLTYPTHPGANPRAWVSMGKHANYNSQSSCNSGGTLGTDDCGSNNTSVVLEWSADWNLGSSTSPLIDCVASRNLAYEYYGSGRFECYWTGTEFSGWIPNYIGGARASNYGPQLTAAGF